MPELGWDIYHRLHLALVVHMSFGARPAESAPNPTALRHVPRTVSAMPSCPVVE